MMTIIDQQASLEEGVRGLEALASNREEQKRRRQSRLQVTRYWDTFKILRHLQDIERCWDIFKRLRDIETPSRLRYLPLIYHQVTRYWDRIFLTLPPDWRPNLFYAISLKILSNIQKCCVWSNNFRWWRKELPRSKHKKDIDKVRCGNEHFVKFSMLVSGWKKHFREYLQNL